MKPERKIFRKGDNYTIPKVKYRYGKLSWEDYMSNKYKGFRTIRSSFIPVTVIGDETFWLLGSFWDYPKDILADFGGDCRMWEPPSKRGKRPKDQERNRQSPFGCSMIELFEESKGLLVQPILKSLGSFDTNSFGIYEGLDNWNKERVIFMLVPVNYDEVADIPYQFGILPDPTYEKLGPLDFYSMNDLFAGKYRITRNLNDFLSFFKRN